MFEAHTVKRRAVRQAASAAALLALCALLFGLAKAAPEAFFNAYIPFSRLVSRFLAFLFSFAPFSIAEFILYALAIAAVVYLIWSVISVFTRTGGVWILLRFAMDLIFTSVLLAFVFFLFWGMNYLAPPLEQRLNLDVRDRPEEALYATAEWLVTLIEKESDAVPRDESGAVDAGGFSELAKKISESYKVMVEKNPVFKGGGVSPPKRVTGWLSLTYMGIAGIYSPFTGESNVNPHEKDAYLPFTMAHEMAHRLGFAAENDANFIAFKACMDSPYPEIRYSGALIAFYHCVGAISDGEQAARLWALVPQGVWDDINAARAMQEELSLNSELQEAVSGIANEVNDSYLRVMGQSDGVKSYGRVVDLLIAEYVSIFGEPSIY